MVSSSVTLCILQKFLLQVQVPGQCQGILLIGMFAVDLFDKFESFPLFSQFPNISS